MLIKLLCVEEAELCEYNSDEPFFIIHEGDIVNAIIDEDGVRFEYEENTYSLPYYYEDIAKYFISAFDADSYNKIYKHAIDCTMYLEDGWYTVLGDGIVKMEV